MKNSGTLKVTTPTEREIVMTRDFDVPRSLLFDALTKPEMLKHWHGPEGWSLVVCEVELKVGGTWHFVMRRDDGTEFGMHGIYHEISPPERIVRTESYGDDFWGELLVTVELVEQAGKTTLTTTVLHPSQEVRDANAGMAQGASQSFDKLAEFLTTLA